MCERTLTVARLQYVLKEPVIVGVFRVVLHFASPLQALANVLELLLPTQFVCGSLTPAPPRTALQSLKSGRKKMGTPNPKKPLHGAPPPSPSPHAGLDELARDKRLCGPAMKGLLTILHPPEALPAGHRLPECHSLSRPQSQHAPLPFSANPCRP